MTISVLDKRAIQKEIASLTSQQISANAAYDRAVRKGDVDGALDHLHRAKGLGEQIARLGNSIR